ncbi:hypothetical protein [Lysobacter brunescens]|uniref:Uncharacterized protein n=1 Tax=Lysobacter brunescens TaxID=262323 RepID=A0ABW2YKJ6_9GAMM
MERNDPNHAEHGTLTDIEIRLLSNVLDALDRLFDGDSSPIDIHDLLLATGHALKHPPSIEYVLDPVPGLQAILRNSGSPEDQQQLSLEATNNLRHYLADLDPLISSWACATARQ